MTQAELDEILADHGRWLAGRAGGVRATLSGADLAGMDFSGADLAHAVLARANLSGADLSRARLARADLTCADLSDANLYGANLTLANLYRANLARTSLTGADLTGANLTRESLAEADLSEVRSDIVRILESAPTEARAVLTALREGRVDGSTYEGECACLVGTIANARHDGASLDEVKGELDANPRRPAEMLFAAIRVGDTPSTNPVAALAAA